MHPSGSHSLSSATTAVWETTAPSQKGIQFHTHFLNATVFGKMYKNLHQRNVIYKKNSLNSESADIVICKILSKTQCANWTKTTINQIITAPLQATVMWKIKTYLFIQNFKFCFFNTAPKRHAGRSGHFPRLNKDTNEGRSINMGHLKRTKQKVTTERSHRSKANPWWVNQVWRHLKWAVLQRVIKVGKNL